MWKFGGVNEFQKTQQRFDPFKLVPCVLMGDLLFWFVCLNYIVEDFLRFWRLQTSERGRGFLLLSLISKCYLFQGLKVRGWISIWPFYYTGLCISLGIVRFESFHNSRSINVTFGWVTTSEKVLPSRRRESHDKRGVSTPLFLLKISIDIKSVLK